MNAEHHPGRVTEVPAVNVPTQRNVVTPDLQQPAVRTDARRPRWQTRYARLVVASDLLAIAVSAVSYGFWGSVPEHSLLSATAVVMVIGAACLFLDRAWDPAVLGQGSVEFTRLLHAMLAAAVSLGLVSLAIQMPAGRPWVFGVLPLAGALAIGGRIVLRRGLHRRRRQGGAMARVLGVGTEESVASLIRRTRRAAHHGWTVTGVCTPTGAGPNGATHVEGVPVLGDLDSATRLGCSAGFDAVSVAQAPGWTPRRLQQLAWDLEGTGTELVVDPGLMEIAGPRLHMANVDGLPLLRLTHPTFTGAAKLVKAVLDRAGALALLVLISPVLLVLAVAVVMDGGPAFFRQTRVGLDGRDFKMIKFRSMVVDAEARLDALRAANTAAGPMFKMHNDPRVTRIGAVLRTYSLDELPQLFNVLGGSMSLVGPRPPLPTEIVGYERAARRRLLVKPGMTGLWQVSGRSDLTWEETVRLDLRYVENWSFALDAQILVRTARAMVKGSGAY